MRAYRVAIQEAEQQKPKTGERSPDDMLETANHLVRISIQALMRMRGVDWETALDQGCGGHCPKQETASRVRITPISNGLQPLQHSPHTPA